MPLLNPFLRAFFRSALPAQCTPVQDYILLVPTTEILTSSRDRESGLLYSDLAGSDEFLGSHVLRIPSAGSGSPMVGARENRGKARQFTTFNGRTVVVKDFSVYTNKGFRSLIQTQLLNDILYYPDTSEPQQWLMYFINRPLTGSLEQIPIIPPLMRDRSSAEASSSSKNHGPAKRKDIKSFNELLMLFPMIARQVQPGLEKLFQDFEISFEKYKPLPLPPSPSSQSTASGISSRASIHSSINGDIYKQAADESEIRKSLESAITVAVDLFQRIDQTHFNHLSSSTDLTGPAIDRLIERYVTEQLHDSILFPRICATKRIEDEELEQKIFEIENVDLSQVGIPSLDQQEKASLVRRLTAGIKCFSKIGSAKSPQAMVEFLLETAQILTRPEEEPVEKKENSLSPNSTVKASEKAMSSTVVTMNADMLVSLLLVVVIRAKVPNLHASLSYMRNFIFVEDVEQGETGYILSTLEAVLFHIAQDHSLSVASRANERLWRSVRSGDLLSVKRLLEPVEGKCSNAEEDEEDEDEPINKDTMGEESAKVTMEVSSPTGNESQSKAEIPKDLEGLSQETINKAETCLAELRVRSPFNPGHGRASPATLSTTISSKVLGSGGLPDGILSKDSSSINEITSLDGQAESASEIGNTGEVLLPITDDAEVYVDPFESTTDKSSRGIGISNIRLEDVRTDGLDDSDSLSGILRVPTLKLNTSVSQNGAHRTGIARFDLAERSPIKFPRNRSAVSLSTTIGDVSTFSKLSRAVTSQNQNQDSFSTEKLSKTRNSVGESILMMAVQERKVEVLRYLLGTQFFDVDFLLEDCNNDGTTLLSAAVQLENMEIVEILLKELLSLSDEVLKSYFAKKDNAGRTVAHYLFNAPDLISRLGQWLPWTSKDKNGQTPLFALCRSYDHHRYKEMVGMAIKNAQASQVDGQKLHLDDHVDSKGNTLLHIAGDPAVLKTLLKCDSEVNAVNERGFTALMVASKYGRLETVRAFFTDPRVDLLAKELRGMTAVELAKDDDVRNRIDDLVLFQNPPADDGRVTAVVRSFFVEDATIRVVLKSGAPSGESTFTITTCRRSLADFQFLAEWLAYENPASWLPALIVPRSPYQIPSKPSRAVLRDIQLRLDNFLRTLLSHSTFSTHELLWEFFLVPDIQQELMIERSKKKAETRIEKIREEVTPVDDTRDIETFVSYAKDSVRSINYACRSVTRRGTVVKTSLNDVSEAFKLSVKHLSCFKFLQETEHLTALTKLSETLVPNESHPYTLFLEDFRNIQASLTGVMTALDRPKTIISQMSALHKQIDKHVLSLRRSDRWPLGLLDETRAKIHQDAADKVAKTKEEYLALASELRYTQSVAAQELAEFHELHEKQVKRAVKTLAKRQIVAEKAKLEAMKRAVRGVLG